MLAMRVQTVARPDRPSPLVQPVASGPALLAKFFRGLGDPTRIRILQLLVESERTVGELVHELDSLQGRVSSHLACLRWCGFVTSRREGTNVYYRVTDTRVRKLLDAGADFLQEHCDEVSFCQLLDPKQLPKPMGPKRRTQ